MHISFVIHFDIGLRENATEPTRTSYTLYTDNVSEYQIEAWINHRLMQLDETLLVIMPLLLDSTAA